MNASRTLNNKKIYPKVLDKFTPGPINSLPPEILGQIFIATLDKTIPAHSAPPMILCHVSALWKQIALSMPCLWKRLAINRDATVQDMVGIISGWFSLARGLPLSLHILNTQTWRHSSDLSSSLENSSSILAPQRLWRHIHNLEIDMYWMSDAIRLLNVLVCGETDLERLTIYYSQWSRPPFIRLKFPPFYKLKRFVLSCYHSEPIASLSFDNMPWNQLTHLSMVDVTMTPTMWMVFLRRCIHLQQGFFALNAEDSPQGLNVFQGDTTFPSIISLKVAFKYRGDWGILNGLSFPSLQTLCLGGMHLRLLTTWPSTTSSTLDAPLVKNLTLFRVRIQYTDLAALLERMAGLRALVLDIPVHCSPLFERLSHIGTDVFLPNLVRLSIYHWRRIQYHPNNFDQQAFLCMMRARWYPSSTTPRPLRSSLSSVSIRIAKDSSEFNKLRLKLNPLIKRGLFLQIGLAPAGYPLKKELDW